MAAGETGDWTGHPAALAEAALLGQCEVRRARRSGPGGQRRNKVETAVVLRHRPTGLRAEASERRSPEANRRMALRRLRLKLAMEHRQRCSPDAPPSGLWRSRCRSGRVSINPSHEDYPALLAEALDAIAAHDADVKGAAAQLGCTASQLVKLLRDAPPALERINEQRRQRGLPALK